MIGSIRSRTKGSWEITVDVGREVFCSNTQVF